MKKSKYASDTEKWKEGTHGAWYMPQPYAYISAGDRAFQKASLWTCEKCDNVYSLDVNSSKKKQYNYSALPKKIQPKKDCASCRNKYTDLKVYYC
jgi:hypothetical protein